MSLYVPGTDFVYESGLDNLIQHIRTNSVRFGAQVTAHAAPDMGVRVTAGSMQALGLQVAIPQTDLVVAAAGVNPRYDLVHVDMITGIPAIIAGAPAATPKPPALPANSIELGIVGVGVGAVNIQAGNIGDRRLIQQVNAGFATVMVGDGAAATPTLTFWNDTDSGIFRIGTNDLGIAVGGTLTVEIGATYFALGTLPATTGAARLANAASISWSNAAHTADVAVLTLDGSNNVILSNTISAKSIVIQQTNGAGSVQLVVPAGGTLVFGNTAIDYLTSTATTGVIDFTATGSSANIDLRWVPKGTGLVDFRYAVTALGGGAVPTLGTIGGTGPAVQGQNSWLKVLINGVASFFPVWR